MFLPAKTTLVLAWLFGALRAGGPYPVLAIAGEQGSAKTVLSKILRALIDPNVAPRLPRMADFALWATACASAFRTRGHP